MANDMEVYLKSKDTPEMLTFKEVLEEESTEERLLIKEAEIIEKEKLTATVQGGNSSSSASSNGNESNSNGSGGFCLLV